MRSTRRKWVKDRSHRMHYGAASCGMRQKLCNVPYDAAMQRISSAFERT